MMDITNVISALGCFLEVEHPSCDECPYKGGPGGCDLDHLMTDARKILKKKVRDETDRRG
jgi:hypothetical protein